MKQGYADIVEKNSLQINIEKQQYALKPARCCYTQETTDLIKIKRIEYLGKQDVYNMEVKTHHNFSVNGGLIVHNSIDMTRYALNDDIRAYIEEKKVESDPDNPTQEEQYQRMVSDVTGGTLKVNHVF